MKKLSLLFYLLAFGVNLLAIEPVELDEMGKKEAFKLIENVRKKIQREEKEKQRILAEEKKRIEAKEKARLEEEAKLQKKLEEERKEVERLELEKQAQIDSKASVEKMGENLEKSTTKKYNISNEEALEEYLKEKNRKKKEENSKIKTAMQKLEATQKLANEKVDFYERVTRSVAREEKEVKEYKEILDLDI